MSIANLNDNNNDSPIGKFAGTFLSRSDVIRPNATILDSNTASGFYINNQKLDDLFLNSLSRKHEILGVASVSLYDFTTQQNTLKFKQKHTRKRQADIKVSSFAGLIH